MATPAQILVVDDEPNIRLTLQMVLEGEGWEVALSHSAEDALARLADEPCDAMLLDVMMPGGMDGLTALGLVHAKYPDLPVVMISGHATLHDAVSATRAGAFDFLEKPLSRERVLVTVRNALRESSRGRGAAPISRPARGATTPSAACWGMRRRSSACASRSRKSPPPAPACSSRVRAARARSSSPAPCTTSPSAPPGRS